MDVNIKIAVPIGKNHQIDIRTAAWCAAMHRCQEVAWMWSVSHYPEMGRNAIIQQVLEQEPTVTHLFFVDTDTVPPIDALKKMLDLNQGFVSGMTPMISTKQHLWNVKHKGSEQWIDRDAEIPAQPFKAEYVGGSCLLVRRDVLEAIGWPWFKTIFKQMDSNLVAKEKGEDMFICDRARECGFDLWVHPDVKCSHYQYINLLTFLHE